MAKPRMHSSQAESVTQPCGGRGRCMLPRLSPSTRAALAIAAGRRGLHPVSWRHGTHQGFADPTAAMRSRFLALRARPANRDIPAHPTPR